jgi:dTDP-4-amino-4,6-dideoxygalactose transaminase
MQTVEGRAVEVPLLDLKAQYAGMREEIESAMRRVVESQHFILGPEVAALEREVAAYSGAAHGVGMSSGTDALLAALMAVGVGPGDDVVTTPFTFFATAGVIVRLGARPAFVDIEPATFNMDATRAVAAIGERTRALLPVHLYGRVAHMDALLAAAAEHDIPVIEDAAQAIGSADAQGRRAGAIGDMGCFSFFPSKNLGGFGDGGMVVTNSTERAAELASLRMHGMEPKYYHSTVGGNFRLDALQAAVLRIKLRRLDDWSAARRRNAARYRELFNSAGLAGTVGLPADEPGHSYNQFVVRLPERDALRRYLQERKIGTEIYYPLPLHLQECFRYLGHAAGDFPESEKAAAEVLALPIYPELSAEQQEHVVVSIAQFYG